MTITTTTTAALSYKHHNRDHIDIIASILAAVESERYKSYDYQYKLIDNPGATIRTIMMKTSTGTPWIKKQMQELLDYGFVTTASNEARKRGGRKIVRTVITFDITSKGLQFLDIYRNMTALLGKIKLSEVVVDR